MIIAINTRILSEDHSINNFLQEVFSRIIVSNPEHEFIFITEKKYDPPCNLFKNVKTLVIEQQSTNPLLWKLWYNYKLPAALKKINADLLVTVDGVCSLRCKLPQLLLVKDLGLLQHADCYPKKYTRFIQSKSNSFLQKATTIITSTQILKENLVSKLGIAENKIAVIYPGVIPLLTPMEWEQTNQIKEKFTEGKEYFLYNGPLHLQGNLINLLKAFSIFKKRQKTNMQLIIAATGIKENEYFIKSLQLYKYRSEVILLHNPEEINLITAAAYAIISPAIFENNFSILLNALQCKVPVLAGNTNVNIEILGNAAGYINPDMVDDIAEKMMLLFKDEKYRATLIENGLQQAAKFSWNKAADELWQQMLLTIE